MPGEINLYWSVNRNEISVDNHPAVRRQDHLCRRACVMNKRTMIEGGPKFAAPQPAEHLTAGCVPGQFLILVVARRCCGLTLRELGMQVGGLDYAAVSIAIKRFEKSSRKSKTLRAARARAEELLKVET